MNIFFYSCKKFELPYLSAANTHKYCIELSSDSLNLQTVHLAKGFIAISIFTGDDASAEVIQALYEIGVRYIATRAAGFDNIDIDKANELGIKVANVPEYSPHAIAEFAVGMMINMSRKITMADKQVHQNNFALDNLVGFNLHNKKVGIIGTGRIGSITAKILHGFGCRIFAYDVKHDAGLELKYGVTYTDLQILCSTADIITIHTPLNEKTKYLVNNDLIKSMKKGVMIINTARGPIVNTKHIITNLQTGQIGFYGMDVYEKEKGIFFYDLTNKDIKDETLKELLAMPNVLVTPHQSFASAEALKNIADTTMNNFNCWDKDETCKNELPHILNEV